MTDDTTASPTDHADAVLERDNAIMERVAKDTTSPVAICNQLLQIANRIADRVSWSGAILGEGSFALDLSICRKALNDLEKAVQPQVPK